MAALSPPGEPMSSRRWLTIVGIGEDGRAGLSPAATAALDAAEVVYGGRRHFELAGPLTAERRSWPSPIHEAYPGILARRGQATCILATGDPFHYGIGAEIARLVPADEIAAFPQPSAFSLACARLVGLWRNAISSPCMDVPRSGSSRICGRARACSSSRGTRAPPLARRAPDRTRLRGKPHHGAGSDGRPARADPQRPRRGFRLGWIDP